MPEPSDDRLSEALDACQRGDWLGADQICREILAARPDLAEAWHLRGLATYQQNQIDQALAFLSQAVALAPDTPHFYCNLGNTWLKKQDRPKALAAFQRALELDPALAEAHYQSGNLYLELAQWPAAQQHYQAALQLGGARPVLHYHLGLALEAQGYLEQALEHLQPLASLPGFEMVHRRLGSICSRLGQLEPAMRHYSQAVALQPEDALLQGRLGDACFRQGDPTRALAAYQQAIALNPAMAEAWQNAGNVYRELRRLEQAKEYYQQALRLRPDFPAALTNLGNVLLDQGSMAEAISHFHSSLALDPGSTKALVSLGNAYLEQGNIQAAQDCYTEALRLDPQDAEAVYNRAYARLLSGDILGGFADYEARWLRPGQEEPLPSPRWQGELLPGKTLLLRAEQGLGDTLQFIRFVKMAHPRVGRIVLQCQQTLWRLLAPMPGIGAVLPLDGPVPPFDAWTFLMSLPHIFGTDGGTVPGDVPYLEVPDARHLPMVEAHGRAPLRRIGIVWAGSPQNRGDRQRSCPLEYFRPLFDVSGIEWYSLQVGERGKDLYRPHPVIPPDSQASPSTPASAAPPLGKRGLGGVPTIIDLSPAIQDFADTAAIISQLDLVISVDTAVAHLAGALAKPVWILLSYIPDWRWMLKRSDSPWYPTATLFRQSAPGDWDSVIAQVHQALRAE